MSLNRKCLILAITAGLVLIGMPVFAADAAANFKAKCAMCHGADGGGQTATGKMMKAPDLRSAAVQKESNEKLEKVIESGKGKMPAYKGKLTDAEIDALVKFVKKLK